MRIQIVFAYFDSLYILNGTLSNGTADFLNYFIILEATIIDLCINDSLR